MMFECPACHERHRVNDNYDQQDFICLNSANRQTPKTFQDMTPEDLLTRNSPLWNRSSTKIDEKRAVTVVGIKTSFHMTGEKIGTKKLNY